MAFRIKRTFMFFGYGLQVKKGDSPSRRVGHLFPSRSEAQAYANRHHTGQKTHIFGIRLESTPIDAPVTREKVSVK